MKKFIIALVACLALGTSAFAGGDDGFSIGYTYGIFGMDDAAGNTVKEMGSGLYLNYYNSQISFFGLDLTCYIDFPRTQKYRGTTSSIPNDPFILGFTFMPTFNLPIGDFLDLRVGAGIGLMVRHEDLRIYGETFNFNLYMLTFPIGVSAQFKFAKFCGLKVGCDFQFKFAAWAKLEDLDLSSIGYDVDNNAYFINPYIAFTFLF